MDNNVVAKHILDVAVGLEKKSKAELITELSDIFDNASKIDLNSKENINSLKNLAKAFEAIFSKAGNKSINFADLIEMPPPAMFAEMGKIAATSFWDAWNSVSGGMSDNLTANLEESLKQLKLEQADLKRERTKIQAEINKRVSNKEKADGLIDFDDKTVKSLKVEGDIIQKAKEMYIDLRNTAQQLRNIEKEQGKDSQEYIKSLYEAQDVFHDMYRMRKTLQKTEVKVPESMLAAYGLLEYDDSDGFHVVDDRLAYEEKAYNAGRTPNVPFYETKAGEFIGDRWERFVSTVNKSQKELKAVEDRLTEIDSQISEITKSIQATGGSVGVVVQSAENGLKALNEIKTAYEKIRVDGEKRIDKRYADQITSALEFDPDKSGEGIKSLYDQYQRAAESGDWVEEYRALLKYVRLYESYLTTANKTHSNKITRKDNPFTPLYEQLKPMADNAQNMLQNILNMGEGKPLIGMGGTGSGGDGGGPTPEDIANAQKLKEEAEAKAQAEKAAREEIEKKLQAEREIEESKKKQRIEEEKLAKAAEKKRLADEAAVEANHKAADEAKESTSLIASDTRSDSAQSNIKIILEDMNKFLSSHKDKKIKDYFDLIAAGAYEMSDDVKSAIEATIGEISKINSIGIGANNFGGLIGDKSALILKKPTQNIDQQNADAIKLQDRLNDTEISDVNLGKIQEVIKTEEYLVELQSKVSGEPLSTMGEAIENINPDVLNATEKSIRSLIQAMYELYNAGIQVETENLGNILYDGQSSQFGIVDMDIAEGERPYKSFEEMLSAFTQTVRGQVEDITEVLGNPELAKAWSRFADMVDNEVEKITSSLSTTDSVESSPLVQKYNQASDAVKQLTDKLAYLDRQMQTLDERTSAVNMDGFDQWNPSDEHKERIVKTLGEYQNIIKQIADFPIVQSEDDKKRLIELKEEALKLANTLKLAYRSDSNPDSYIKDYGISRDQARVFMDIQNESARLRTEIRNELNSEFGSTFAKIQEADKDFARTILDNADDLYQLASKNDLSKEVQDATIDDQLKETIALLEKEKLTYEDILALVKEYNNESKMQDLAKAGNWDEYDKIFAHHADIAKKLVPVNMMGIGSDSPDKWLATVGMSAEDAAQRLKELYDRLHQVVSVDDELVDHDDVVATEQAVDGLNESLEKTQQLISGGGTGDVSSAELEAERAKVESLQAENDALQDRLQKQADEMHDEAYRNQEARAELYKQISEAEERVAMYDRAMTSMEEEMADLRGQLADAKTGGGEEHTSASLEELKTLLDSIVYNVKIVHDDNDKTANKIALDDSTLEATLTKVFANILNPQTQQNDLEQKQAPWALDNTLLAVKGIIENIHANTTKIGTINPSNVDTMTVTTLDGKLTEIKSVLESIDGKIAKGGVIATRGAVKQAAAQPVESEVKAQAARSNMMKSLINDYKSLGKLSAKFASDNNLETKAMLENLKEEISRKRKSLKLTMDESASLREKYSMAFDAEKRLLDAEKAQKEIDKQNKANAKEAENAWKKQVKDAQRATGINAATSAANAGDQTAIRAIGTEGISKDIEDKAKELSKQIKVLRILRDEIDKKGEQATNKDRDNLSKQISRVKELKAEVDGYLKIHEKYSGEGATQFNNVDTSNFGAVGTDEYWNNITAAIKNAAAGRTTIKGMNTDTGELTGTTKIAANTFAEWSATVDPITGKLSMLRTGIKRTETIIESITRKTKEIFTYFSGSSIIFKAFNELKKGVQYVRDIDLALTELKKVTDETEETYDRFLKTAAKTADKVGSTIQKVVSSTADWARLGSILAETNVRPVI